MDKGVERVPTRVAARIYGFTVKAFLKAMKQEGVVPEVRKRTTYQGGKSYWWDPRAVLKARAVRAARQQAAQRAIGVIAKRVLSRGSRLLARESQLERQRNRRLSKIATARGMTVKELRIALGIDMP